MQNVPYAIKYVDVPKKHIDFLSVLPANYEDHSIQVDNIYTITNGNTLILSRDGKEYTVREMMRRFPSITTFIAPGMMSVHMFNHHYIYDSALALHHITFMRDHAFESPFVAGHANYLKTLSCCFVPHGVHFPALEELHVRYDNDLHTVTVTPKLLRAVTVGGKPVNPTLIDRDGEEHCIPLYHIVQGNAQKRAAAVALGCALKRMSLSRDMYMYVMSWAHELDPWEVSEKRDVKKIKRAA